MSDTDTAPTAAELAEADARRVRLTAEFDEKQQRAEDELYLAREGELRAKATMHRAREKLANALMAWQRGFIPRTIKEELERQRDIDVAAKLAGTQPKMPAIGPSQLDAVLSHGRGGGRIDGGIGKRPHGSGKQFKGYTVPPKLPSAR